MFLPHFVPFTLNLHIMGNVVRKADISVVVQWLAVCYADPLEYEVKPAYEPAFHAVSYA